MKFKLFPVIATAALTTVMTLAITAHFRHNTPYFTAAQAPQQGEARYAAFDNAQSMAGAVNFEAAAAAAVSAVVHVKTTTNARTVVANGNDLFTHLFGPQQYVIPSQQGSGSGVVISPDGYIVTNNHVVAGANEVTVTFNDRHTAQAKVVGTDPGTDIAVLKVDNDRTLPYMQFGNSDNVKLGQWVLAVGYPLSLDATVTAGIISAKGRSIGVNKTKSSSAIESFIQTDAAVNPGNSGGALVNTAGHLIGINSAIASPTGSYAGYSYAIPANIVRKAVNDLMKYGSVQRGYMGIKYLDRSNVTPEHLAELGIDESIFEKSGGVYVLNVLPNTGAEKAGIRKGDYITEVNGIAVNTEPELQGQIARYQPGDNVSIMYNRGGSSHNAIVELTNINRTTGVMKEDGSGSFLGAIFRPLTDKERTAYKQNGVVLTDLGNGQLARQTQMKNGFVITGINNNAVNSIADLQQLIAESKALQISGFYPGNLGMYYFGLNNTDDDGGSID